MCQRDMVFKMMNRFRELNREWLRVLILMAYVYQFRVFSEYLIIRYIDIQFVDMSLPLGVQKLIFKLDGRKNRRYRHPLERKCTCVVPPKKGEIPLGVDMCVVHQFYEYLKNDPYYALALRTDSPHLVIGGVLDHAAIIPAFKNCARECGDLDWQRAASHGPRRGFACDLALYGAKLKAILEGGDWRSPAFQDYLASIKDQLLSKAVMQMVGEASDSDEE